VASIAPIATTDELMKFWYYFTYYEQAYRFPIHEHLGVFFLTTYTILLPCLLGFALGFLLLSVQKGCELAAKLQDQAQVVRGAKVARRTVLLHTIALACVMTTALVKYAVMMVWYVLLSCQGNIEPWDNEKVFYPTNFHLPLWSVDSWGNFIGILLFAEFGAPFRALLPQRIQQLLGEVGSGSQENSLAQSRFLSRLQEALPSVEAQLGMSLVRLDLGSVSLCLIASLQRYGDAWIAHVEAEPGMCLLVSQLKDRHPHALNPASEQQCHNDFAQLMQEGSVAQRALKVALAPSSDWASIERGSIEGAKDGWSNGLLPWLDVCVDPGLKGQERALQKAQYKYSTPSGVRYARLRDLSRMALQFHTAQRLLVAIEKLLDLFELVILENRFREPTPLGWADITMLVRVPLPQGGSHIAELQLQLIGFAKARREAHVHYRKLREVLVAAEVPPEESDRALSCLLSTVEGHKFVHDDAPDEHRASHNLQSDAEVQSLIVPSPQNQVAVLSQHVLDLEAKQAKHTAELGALQAEIVGLRQSFHALETRDVPNDWPPRHPRPSSQVRSAP